MLEKVLNEYRTILEQDTAKMPIFCDIDHRGPTHGVCVTYIGNV